jgi:GT2 family glycosyltransferase
MSLTVAICIATHNRREDLARTLRELARLQPPPDELVIAADGCRDGTAELVREIAPRARLIEHATPRGSIASRNELAEACGCDVFVNLDDDSYPLDQDFIARVRRLFERQPRLSVAAFPQRSDEFPESLEATDFGPSLFVGTFADSGAAIRRSVFLELGRFPAFFFHAYEEPDFALRCVCAGWQVRFETSLVVRHHFTKAQRSEIRTHHRHARNEIWSLLLRCPAPQCLAVAVFRVWRQAGYAWQRGWRWLCCEPRWWIDCVKGIPRCLAQRHPLSWGRYLAWMRLVRAPIADEREWNAAFGEGPA